MARYPVYDSTPPLPPDVPEVAEQVEVVALDDEEVDVLDRFATLYVECTLGEQNVEASFRAIARRSYVFAYAMLTERRAMLDQLESEEEAPNEA